MSALADAVVKGGVGTLGILASAYTLTKFIVSTPVKIGERGEPEKEMDLVLGFDAAKHSPAAIEFFLSVVREQSRLSVVPKPAPATDKVEKITATDKIEKITAAITGAPAAAAGGQQSPSSPPPSECFYLVGASAEALAQIKARKEQVRHAQVLENESLPTLSSGERLDLLLFELNRLCVFAPKDRTEGSIPAPFEENDPLFSQALHSGLVKEYFPLHDDDERHQLVETWVKKWRSAQPLDAVRDYFGDEIGFYFAFLEMYSRWLVVPSALGIVVFILEVATSWGVYGRAAYSLFITSWATAFLKFWKRRESTLRNQWDIRPVDDLELEHERPDFQGERRYDPVEDRHFTYFSSFKRMQRYLKTTGVTLVVLAVILQLMFVYFHLDKWVSGVVTPENGWDGYYQYAAFLPSISYSVVVFALDVKYRDFADYLTKYENHRTDTDFANALVLKLASFYFVNNFGLLFFLAFRARDMEQLQQTLSSLLITRQLIGNLQEQLVPYFTATSSLKTEAGKMAKEKHVPEAVLNKVDAELLFPTYEGTFDDYLELFVQFGQVTLFASAYPLAALWCLTNNIMEIRSDGFKLCVSFRRSRRVSTQGIGTWLYAFNALGYLSVMTNCAIFGLHSGLLDKLYPSMSFAGILMAVGLMEHLMLAVKVCIEMFVPDTPTTVVEAQRMQRAALRKKAMLQVELSSRKLQLENHPGEAADQPTSSLSSVGVDAEDRARAGHPEEVLAWMQQEKERRARLEHEVRQLNELYMGWIREEQDKRRAAELQVAELLKSSNSDTISKTQ